MKIDVVDSLGYYAVLCVSKFLRVLPLNVALFLGRVAGLIIVCFSKRRHHAYADLKFAFGESPRWIKKVVRKHYQHLGQTAVEFMRIPDLDKSFIERKITIDHVDKFYDVSQKQKGALLLTAHYGNWELIQIVASLLGHPIHALMRNQKKGKLNQLLNDFRKSRGSQVVSKGISMRGMIKALRQGELIGVLGDQSAGKKDGLIVEFFGRKTTIPTGVFELASRMKVPVLPAFIQRASKGCHKIFVKDPIELGENLKDLEDYRKPVEFYISMLESLIREKPEQWLWAKKRWKYSWTKKIVVLRDGKAGHEKQSAAILETFQNIKTQYDRPGMEYPTEIIDIRYRTKFHQKLLYVLAFLFYPIIQGRLYLTKPFLTDESYSKIRNATADFVISTGSSLIPVNLLLARENRGKSAVVMNPPFPYNYFRYDLSIVPKHDKGRVPSETVRTMLTPSSDFLNSVQSNPTINLESELLHPEKVKIGLFLGGQTGEYRLDVVKVEKIMRVLQRISPRIGDYILTTSRRTTEDVTKFIKRYLEQFPACQKAIIASEDSRSGVVEEMLSLCDILIVTEDSLSMISECVSSAKEVYVLRVDDLHKLPEKHKNFTADLEARGVVVVVEPESLEYQLLEEKNNSVHEFILEEQNKIEERVRQIL